MHASALVWFRLDLRLSDNPALEAAAERGYRVVPLFIWAPEEEGQWPPGAASRWWLHQSLQSLDAALRRHGSKLVLRRGPSLKTLRKLVHETGARAVFWNQRVEPALRARDSQIQNALQSDGISVEIRNSALIYDPEEIRNASGRPYRVFTPFWRECTPVGPYQPKDPPPVSWRRKLPDSVTLKTLELEPAGSWIEGLDEFWTPGEPGANNRLEHFLHTSLAEYAIQRDFPAVDGTSRLSPHLHFGEISPLRVLSACVRKGGKTADAFIRQLGWREFAHHLLYHFPETPESCLRPRYAKFPWRQDIKGLRRWQQGRTGFPIIDAGMRELWATGWMHNRVRMLAGSFLVKDLLLPWHDGARWFWDTLVDADLANNTLGWQWVAGCGADAAPFFRIFNPKTQSEKYDPAGTYIRQWIRELGTPEYPQPMIDHRMARERALEAFASIKK